MLKQANACKGFADAVEVNLKSEKTIKKLIIFVFNIVILASLKGYLFCVEKSVSLLVLNTDSFEGPLCKKA